MNDTFPRTAKHEQLTASLRALAQTLRPGDRLPSQNALMRQFGVSDRTVLRSLDDLRRAGWIVRKNGSGTFVADRRPHGESAPAATNTLAVLVLAANPFFRNCVDHLTAQAARAGFSVVCHYADHRADREAAQALEALQPAGFVVFSYELADVAAFVRERGHRAVLLGVPPPHTTPAVPCVYGDHEHGAFLATRRLLDLGHRRIAYARHFPDVTWLTTTRRWQGHRRALAEAGLGHDTPPIIPILPWKILRDDPNALRAEYARVGSPTGIVVWTDDEALQLLPLLRRIGLHVPRDVSLIAYDNVPLGEHSDPPLDTIDPHLDVQIRHALALLESPPAAGHVPSVVVTPTLLRRESCAFLPNQEVVFPHPR